jgi:putative transposase
VWSSALLLRRVFAIELLVCPQFKTLKYRPDFPARFGAYEDAEAFCQRFFPWYNIEHRHSALGLMTPHDIHYGLAQAKWQRRADLLRAAYHAHPERFPRGVPVPRRYRRRPGSTSP